MRCLNCRTDKLSKDLALCPNCGVAFASLFRNLLPPGEQLQGGMYEIEHALGQGGFGVTYQARHVEFKRTVAIKEFYPQDYALRVSGSGHFTVPRDKQEPYQRWLQRFKREGQILFDLNHPSIVRVQNLFSEYDTAYLVMELLDGHTLKDELTDPITKHTNPLKEARIVEIMDALVSALAVVHQRRLYHLDLKPDNVMVSTDEAGNERIVLIDFGAARQELIRSVESSGKRSTVAYTEAYAPPELFLEAGQSAASDIFELGVMLHEMLTGELPPSALKRSLGTAKTWQPTLSEPWQGLVASALRLEPAERPQEVTAWWGGYRNWYNRKRDEKQRQREAERQRQEQAAQQVAQVRREQEEQARCQQEAERQAAVAKAEQAKKEAERQAAAGKAEAARREAERRKRQPTENTVARRILLLGGAGLGSAFLWEGLRSRMQPPNTNSASTTSPAASPSTAQTTPTSLPSSSQTSIGLKRFNFETVTVDDRGSIVQRQQSSAEYFIEALGNGISLEMVSIPSGSFMMGSPESEKERESYESPQHRVNLKGYYLGKYAVTQAQYEAIMGSNPSNFKGANRPVENVSWNDAQSFCQKLSAKTGKEYRLPSEAEWEYACRAGTTTPFYYGATLSTEIANYNGNYTYGNGVRGQNREQTTEVGSFPANAWGLYDMHGNVMEWCADAWYDNYNSAPSDGSARKRNSTDALLRGGSWYFAPRACRSADRGWGYADSPVDYGYADYRIVDRSFRVALSSLPDSL